MVKAFSLRWAFNTSQWHPSPNELDFLSNLLPTEEKNAITQFQQYDDKKRAIISRLMQRRCVQHCFGIPFERVCIKRTKGKKPYAVFDGSLSEQRIQYAPNFNFNVSHEGSYVALASEGLFMCGVDVSAPQCLRRKNPPPFDQTLKLFERCFSPQEYGRIRALYPRLDAMELEFRKYWSLKEAFTKARGDGIAFGLNQTDFQLLGGRAELFINGEEQTRWRFNVQKFGDHIFSVALGPPDEIIDEYGGFQSMLLRKQLTEDEFEQLHELPEQQFQLIQLDDLIPDSQQSQLHQQYVQ